MARIIEESKKRFLIDYRARRKAVGLSQVDLANKLGVSQSLVSQFERNIDRVQINTLIKFCEAIDADINMVFIEEAI